MNTENYKKQIRNFLNYYDKPVISSKYDTISWLTWLFTNKVPYENLSKIIKNSRINQQKDTNKFRFPDEVLEEHLSCGFGGTCFSITYTLSNILSSLGIENYILMADMRVGKCVHCGLYVKDSSGQYILDPGYMIPKPIPINKQETTFLKLPSNDVLVKYNEDINRYLLYTVSRTGKEVLRLQFHTKPVNDTDFKRYWEKSFELDSMDALTIENISNEGLFYFRKNHIVKTSFGKKKNQVFNNSDEIVQYLSSFFSIDEKHILTAQQILSQKGEKNKNVIV